VIGKLVQECLKAVSVRMDAKLIVLVLERNVYVKLIYALLAYSMAASSTKP